MNLLEKRFWNGVVLQAEAFLAKSISGSNESLVTQQMTWMRGPNSQVANSFDKERLGSRTQNAAI